MVVRKRQLFKKLQNFKSWGESGNIQEKRFLVLKVRGNELGSWFAVVSDSVRLGRAGDSAFQTHFQVVLVILFHGSCTE